MSAREPAKTARPEVRYGTPAQVMWNWPERQFCAWCARFGAVGGGFVEDSCQFEPAIGTIFS